MKRLLLIACALLAFAAPARADIFGEDGALAADTLGFVGDSLHTTRQIEVIAKTGKCPSVRIFLQGVYDGDSLFCRIEGCVANPTASMKWETIKAGYLPSIGGDLAPAFHYTLRDKIALKSATATSDSTLTESVIYEYTRVVVTNNSHSARGYGLEGGIACVR